MEDAQTGRTVCPICGRGRLVDVAFDAGAGDHGPDEEPKQLSDSSEVDVYSCGHEVRGARLDRADRSLGVETRTSDEPVGDPDVEEPHPRTLGGTA
jgi:uncharacterized Zn finger protein (UPF0148 family)